MNPDLCRIIHGTEGTDKRRWKETRAVLQLELRASCHHRRATPFNFSIENEKCKNKNRAVTMKEDRGSLCQKEEEVRQKGNNNNT